MFLDFRIRERAHSLDERLVKADEVQLLASNLKTAWTALQGDENNGMSWYMHVAHDHLPGMIRRLPCDILQASGDGIERKNQSFKRHFYS